MFFNYTGEDALRILRGRMIEIFKDERSLTGVINFLLLLAMGIPDYMSDSMVTEMLTEFFTKYINLGECHEKETMRYGIVYDVEKL